MWLKAVLCSFFGLISLVSSKVSCGDDCISANKCAAASTADQAAMAKAFCGITKAEGAKVCCSRLGGSAGKTLTREEKLALFPTECGYINGQRIVGGEPARLNEYPWMAALEFTVAFTNGSKRPQYQCGGSLINSRYVLTAAHCVVPSLTGVRLGELNFLENPDCEVVLNQRKCADSPKDYEIEERIVHPNYTRMGRYNDLALLRLGQAVEYRKFVREICLPITDDLRNKDVSGLVGAVAGWGLTEYNLYPSALRHVELTIYKSEQCDKALQSGNSTQPPSTVSGKLCAAETNKDSCRGDSGGPLMVAGDFQGSHRFIQHGIVSYGPSPCGKGGPGIYVNVAAHMDWILDTVRP